MFKRGSTSGSSGANDVNVKKMVLKKPNHSTAFHRLNDPHRLEAGTLHSPDGREIPGFKTCCYKGVMGVVAYFDITMTVISGEGYRFEKDPYTNEELECIRVKEIGNPVTTDYPLKEEKKKMPEETDIYAGFFDRYIPKQPHYSYARKERNL